MGKIFRGIVLAIIGILGVILSLLSSTDLISSPNSSLNSKKIDKNIKKLRELRWFNDLYIDERHHKSSL